MADLNSAGHNGTKHSGYSRTITDVIDLCEEELLRSKLVDDYEDDVPILDDNLDECLEDECAVRDEASCSESDHPRDSLLRSMRDTLKEMRILRDQARRLHDALT